MARSTKLPSTKEGGPQSKSEEEYHQHHQHLLPVARPTKLPQPKSKGQNVIARPSKLPQPKSKEGQNVIARPMRIPVGQRSKAKDVDQKNATSRIPKLLAKGHQSKFSEDLS